MDDLHWRKAFFREALLYCNNLKVSAVLRQFVKKVNRNMKNSSCTYLLSMKYICEPFLIYNHRRPLTLICKLQMEIKWEIKTYLFCSWICCGSKVKWKLFSRMQKQCSFNFAFALSQHSQLSNQSCLFLSSNPTVSLTQMKCYNKTGKKRLERSSSRYFPRAFPISSHPRWCSADAAEL